jgi:hypothetical protein
MQDEEATSVLFPVSISIVSRLTEAVLGQSGLHKPCKM